MMTSGSRGPDGPGGGLAPSPVLMAAMIIHSVPPSPTLMLTSPHYFHDILAAMLLQAGTFRRLARIDRRRCP